MRKLLSFVSKSALVLGLTLQFSHAMSEDENGRKQSLKRKAPATKEPQQQRFKRKALLSHEFSIPEEMLKTIILYRLKMNLKSLRILLLVCKDWYATIKSLPMDVSPWDHQLTNKILKKWPNIRVLILQENVRITDEGLQHVPNLISLTLIGNSHITDEGLQHLTQLRTLNLLGYNRKITDNVLKTLTTLRCLKLWINSTIKNDGILNLTNLTSLHLPYDRFITNQVLENLHNLTHLDLIANQSITDEGLKNLHALTHLDLSGNEKITDAAVKYLTRLISLNLRWGAPKITGNILKTLTNLTHLDLSENALITDHAVKDLTQLRNFIPSPRITWWGIKPLKNLHNRGELQKAYGPNFIADCRYGSMNAYQKAIDAQLLLDPVYYFYRATQYLHFIIKDFKDFTDEMDCKHYNLFRNRYLTSRVELETKLRKIFKQFSETERNTAFFQQIHKDLQQIEEEMLSCPKL